VVLVAVLSVHAFVEYASEEDTGPWRDDSWLELVALECPLDVFHVVEYCKLFVV
jgi:hypothetical protein